MSGHCTIQKRLSSNISSTAAGDKDLTLVSETNPNGSTEHIMEVTCTELCLYL